jgi:uncharacterized repeat protein (TIGR01451 family)
MTQLSGEIARSAKHDLCFEFCRTTSANLAKVVFAFIFLLSFFLLNENFAQAQTSVAQTYYVPYTETDILTSLQTIYDVGTCGASATAPVAPLSTYLSIVINKDNAVLIYDHHEDGYEVSDSNPVQATTQIWGDGNLSNGVAPGYASDILQEGNVVILESSVTPATPDVTIDYDGRDKILSSSTVTISRVVWPQGADTLMADAFELYPVFAWGDEFYLPIGEDSGSTDFEYVGASIMAGPNGATVNIDADNNGSFEITTTLLEGQKYTLNGGLLAGARITSSNPVQVHVITGDICYTYQTRWYNLLPTLLHSNSYLVPVATADDTTSAGSDLTTIWLRNPHATALTINWSQGTTAQTPIVIPANSSASQQLTPGFAYRFTSADTRNFYGFGSIGTAYDWGFTLLPELQLLQQVQVAWGPPHDPDYTGAFVNTAPVWVTAAFPSTSPQAGTGNLIGICIDYNGDGVGALTDAHGNNYDHFEDITEVEQLILYEPNTGGVLDGDQTGMFVYICPIDGSDPADAVISAAWGANPAVELPGAPTLDAGTGLVPMQRYTGEKRVTIDFDANANGILDIGDNLKYEIIVRANGNLPVPADTITFTDNLPSNVSYIAGTTKKTISAVTTSIADDGTGTAFPFDGSGFTVSDAMPAKSEISYTFKVTVDSAPVGECSFRNTVILDGADGNVEYYTESSMQNNGLTFDKFTNGVDADTAGEAVELSVGDAVTWTYRLTNTGTSSLYDFAILDDVEGLISIPTIGSITGDANVNGFLDPGETWDVTHSGVAIEGLYSNTASVIADGSCGGSVSAYDSSHYIGLNAAIDIEKYTNGVDADAAPGPAIPVGNAVTWTYTVENIGNVNLTNVVVTDSQGVTVTYQSGDDGDSILEENEVWTYTGSGTATAGQYSNTGSVTSKDPSNNDIIDSDLSHYFGGISDLTIDKSNSPTGTVSPGDTIDYTVVVTNSGSNTLNGVTITDTAPTGTAYNAGSSSITYPLTKTYLDGFASNAYNLNTGSHNFATNWVDSGVAGGNDAVTPFGAIAVTADDGVATTGRVYVTGGYLRLDRASRYAVRTANLSGATSATLSFSSRVIAANAATDQAFVEIATSTSGPWTKVATISGPSTASFAATSGINITSFISSTTAVRIRNSSTVANGESFGFDDIQILTSQSVTEAAGTLPNLTTGLSNTVNLRAGESATVTFSVDVDDPLNPAITAINNQAFAYATGVGTVNDTTTNSVDHCPADATKSVPGICGCGVADTDTDSDGAYDCNEACDSDPLKTSAGVCGCGNLDTDTDSDGSADCVESCDSDPSKTTPGVCGCGVVDNDTDGDGTANCNDLCPNDITKIALGQCGCGIADTDSDSDGTANCNDACPADASKTSAGQCGCGVADTDTDGDGTANCNDSCPADANKIVAGQCGCGVADTDTDSDGTADCNDDCDNDANKTAVGICGCGVSDVDTDGDLTVDCNDSCPADANKIVAGQCGCGVADTDTDSDGTADCNDDCDNDANKTAVGICGCGVSDVDTDGDLTVDCNDSCPADANKIVAGQCGCGVADTDTDSDGTADCNDDCDNDANKTAVGICGCGVSDVDTDGDLTVDCNDSCPADANKIVAGQCGCGVADTDTDSDGTADCNDDCDNDANKTAVGICGCGVSDVDTDGDLTVDCNDSCPADANKIVAGQCGCGVADTDTDSDGTADCNDDCDNDANKTAVGICGCGVSDVDTDGDLTVDCNDSCPADANKIVAGQCGCGVADTDTDSDGTADCNDDCDNDANKTAVGICGCGVSDVDTDGDLTVDCNDSCPADANKIVAGQCGCGVADTDTDSDGTADCNDDCDNDANKTAVGICGCGVSDVDTDGDLTVDCNDSCPADANKIVAGQCGCGVADTDTDSDGTADCNDDCDNDANKTAVGICGCGVSDVDTDGDLTVDCNDSCPADANKIVAGQCGCGVADTDTDSDGTADCNDDCDNDANKTAVGICGCGVSDVDTDGDLTVDCNDSCPADANKIVAGQCGCGVADTDTDGDLTPDCNDEPAPACPDPDFDGDGELNVVDYDSDADRIPDHIEGDADFDGDGLSNRLDYDSDGDGILDSLEALASAGFMTPGNGGSGFIESPVDTDSDGSPDYLDLDSDADGELDIAEVQQTSDYIPPVLNDLDCDGVDDSFDEFPLPPSYDENGNGIPDYREVSLACETRNLHPVQFSLDGHGRSLGQLAKHSIKYRRNRGNNGQCGKLSSVTLSALSLEAEALYLSIWAGAWSVPSDHYQCESFPVGQCINTNSTPVKAQLGSESDRLQAIIRQCLKRCNSGAAARRIKRQSRQLRSDIDTDLERIPDQILSCVN